MRTSSILEEKIAVLADAAASGLGYAIVNAKDALAYDELIAAIVIVGVLGFCLDSALRYLISKASFPSKGDH